METTANQSRDIEGKTMRIEHPIDSGFPFIELSGIKTGSIMTYRPNEEVVACSPVRVGEGRGSYFNTVHERDGIIFLRTMMGSSDHERGTWVYARETITELSRDNPNYEKAKDILDNSS